MNDPNTIKKQGQQVQEMGLLMAKIAKEFNGWLVEVIDSDEDVEVTAEFSSKSMAFKAIQTATRTLLSRTTEVEFQYRIPNSQPGDCEIHWGHTGSFSRTGIRGRAKRGGEKGQKISDLLTADQTFYEAFFPLDSKHFHLVQDEHGWMVKTGQMGAAWLAIKFPPTKRYIPMGQDQVDSLIKTFEALNKFFST
ncbi:MAG: DUF3156 family protein [Chloroflexota bacterium]